MTARIFCMGSGRALGHQVAVSSVGTICDQKRTGYLCLKETLC